MAKASNTQSTVVRTSRGLSIAGTRITLYHVMDYLQAEWPPKLIQQWLNLTDQQITDVMTYIDTHRAEVEIEYQLILQQAEESRHYWEARNRDRLTAITAQLPKLGQEAARAKLQVWKARLGLA